MRVHILQADGSQGGTLFNVRAVEEKEGQLVCRMEFSDTPKILPIGAFVNVEAEPSDDESEEE